jgi:hypothetical protein
MSTSFAWPHFVFCTPFFNPCFVIPFALITSFYFFSLFFSFASPSFITFMLHYSFIVSCFYGLSLFHVSLLFASLLLHVLLLFYVLLPFVVSCFIALCFNVVLCFITFGHSMFCCSFVAPYFSVLLLYCVFLLLFASLLSVSFFL